MRGKWVPFVLFMVIAGLFCTVSCANMSTFGLQGGVLNKIKKDALERERSMGKHMFAHEAVLFDLNEAVLSPHAKALLTRKAAWLLENPQTTVLIEGHCDFSGSEEYNLILGEKRARAVEAFMSEVGVNKSRMSVTSYGERELVSYGRAEEDLAKNRRVVFSFTN